MSRCRTCRGECRVLACVKWCGISCRVMSLSCLPCAESSSTRVCLIPLPPPCCGCRVVYERAAVEQYFATLPAARGGRANIMAGVWCVGHLSRACMGGVGLLLPAGVNGDEPAAQAHTHMLAVWLSCRQPPAGSSHDVSYAEMVPAERVIREKRRQLRHKRHGGGANGAQQLGGGGAAGGGHEVLDV